MIDFEDIRKRFDLITVIEQNTGQQAVHGNRFRCLFHDDHNPSMVVYPDGKFYCFGCGTRGDIVDIMAKLLNCDIREVVDRLDDLTPATRAYTPRTAPPLERTFTEEMVMAYEARFGDRELAVWRDQGIPADPLYRLRIGFDGSRFVFPWFYRGDPIAFKLRRDDTINPTMEPKYLSRTGSHFDVPYNVDVLASRPDRVLIVEDEKSVLAATAHRLAAVAMPAGQFKTKWVPLFSDVPELVIVADNDDPGIASAEKIHGLLPRAAVVTTPVGKDLFDYHLYLCDACGDLEVAGVALWDWLRD